MKFRSFLSLLAVVVLVLLLASAGGAYWLVGRNPLRLLSSKQGDAPGAAIFVPRQAPAIASLLLNPDQLETFQLVSTPPADRRTVRQELDQLKQSLLATTGLDYKRDVQPWLGEEITLAVTTLDVDRDATNGQQPGYLLAIATREPQQSREFLELFWQKRAIAGSDLVFEQYKGVKIIAANTPAPAPTVTAPSKPQPSKYRLQLEEPKAPLTPAPIASLASAAVGDRFILFANYPKVLREAINNVQAPDLSLERSTMFTQAIEALTQPRVGLTLIDLSKLTQLVGRKLLTPAAQQQEATSVEATVEKTPLDQMLMVGFVPHQSGLLAETALLSAEVAAASEVPSLPLLTQAVGALQYMPGRSAIAASGTNLDRLWTQLLNGLAPYETASQLVNQPLQVLQSRWQLDLPTDVFRWVKGEYALAMVPPDPVSAAGERQPDWLFAAQRPQAEADRQAIAHLDDLARQQGLNVGPLTIGDRTVSAWTRLTTGAKTVSQPLNLQADVQGVHASLGNYELFATSVTAMDTALKAVDRSLLKDGSFQRATAALLQPNNGYLYLDWDASQTLLEERFPVLKVLELAGKPFFSHLRSLTLSSYGGQAGIQRGGALIQLKGR